MTYHCRYPLHKTIFTLWTRGILPVIFLISGMCHSQNLVKNQSFENYSACPYQYYIQMNLASGWSAFRESPDYALACAASVPNPPGGNYQKPHSGYAYGAFICYAHYQNGNYREHICGTLCQPLTIGQKYFVSINVVLAEGLPGYCNNLE